MKKYLSNKLYTRILSLSLVLMSLFPLTANAQSTLCSSSANNQNYEWVTRIKINDGIRTSGKTGYADFTSSAISTLTAGQTYNVEIDVRTNGTVYNEYVKLWLDLNQDNVIQDPQELIFAKNSSFATFKTFTGTVTIPTTAFNGSMIGRMIMQYAASPALCGTYTYGTTYDVKVNILGGVANPVNKTLIVSTIGSGTGSITSSPEGINTANGVNSFDFKENTNVTLIANPTSGSTFLNWSGAVSGTNTNVIVNLNSDKNISANFNYEVPPPIAIITASGPTTVCSPGSVLLTAGSASSYQWLLNNNAISGANSNSYAASQSGSYTVVVKNSVGVAATSAAKVIAVNSLPESIITADNSLTLCPSSSVNLTASEGSSYLWSNGETTRTINAGVTGGFSVTVTNANGCSATSDITSVVVEDNILPVITSPSDITVNSDLGICGATVNFAATATDNCGVTVSYSLPSGSVFGVGTTVVTATAKDTSGNKAESTFTITVLDVLPINAVADEFTLNTCDTFTFSDADLLGNDVDPYERDLKIDFVDQPANGTIVDNNNGTYTFTPNSGTNQTFTTTYTVKPNDGTTVFTGNGHFYEFISAPNINWADAKAAAEARTYNGQSGYLVTITSAEENQFAFSKIGAQGWIGASDAAVEGEWRWVGGPENGQQFWSGLSNGGTVNGAYHAWGGGEPNNAGNEDYAHFRNDGLWNDLPLSAGGIQGYVVEYGGNTNDCNTENTATATITFNLEDNIKPEISAPADISLNATSAAGAIVNYTAPVGTDNCTVTTALTAGFADGATFPIGTTLVTYTATDGSGNIASATFNVEVTGIAPVIVVPTNISVSNDTGICGALVNYTATDTTGIPASTITYDIPSGSLFTIGSATVTATATNAIGTSTKTFIVNVNDNEAPIAIAKDITVLLDASGNASITPEMIDNSSFDNCEIDTMTLDITDFSCSNVGSSSSCSPGTALDFGAGNDYVRIGDPYHEFNNEITVSWWVNFQGNSAWMTQSTFGVDNMGTNVWLMHAGGANGIIWYVNDNGTWRATSLSTTSGWHLITGVADATSTRLYLDGNLTTTTAGINGQIKNNVNSEITIGIDGRIPSRNNAFQADQVAIYNRALTQNEIQELLTDCPDTGDNTLVGFWPLNEGNGVTVTDKSSTLANGVLVNMTDADWIKSNINLNGTGSSNEVTLTVKDVNGNISTATANVTVEDNVKPMALTQAVTVQLDASGNGSTTAVLVDNGSNDACGIQSLVLSKTDFSCANVGANTVTLTVTDNNDNVSTETAIVTVEDNVNPIALAQAVTVQLDASGNGSTTAVLVDNGSNDACGIQSLVLSKTDFSCANVGANTVTLTVTDNNGNVSTETAIVTVEDSVNPTVITQDIPVNLDVAGNVSITPSMIDNGSFDNCSIATLSISKDNFDCTNVGINVVTLTVKDVNGNVSSKTATVTVNDVTAPIAIAQDISIDLDAAGNAIITPDMIDNGSSDACPITLSLDTTTFDCSNIGVVNTVTLTVRDASGNQTSTTATVTVNDLIAPEVITQTVIVSLDENGQGSTTKEAVDNGSNDACGILSSSIDISSFDCDNLGENTVTLTVTDVNGNTATNTAIVTVIDTIAPIVGTQNISVALDANGNASISPEDVLILSEDDVERGDICKVSDADDYAMYLKYYNKYNYNQHDKGAADANKHGKDKDKYNKDGRFSFDENQGSIIKNLDGTAVVTGTLVNSKDANDKWIVTLNLQNPRNWTEWSSLKRKYKGSKKTIGYSYKDWTYYEMAEGSKLIGAGSNAGQETELTQKYEKYGFQVGDNANLENGNYGLSGQFYYTSNKDKKGKKGKKAKGEFNFDITDCGLLPVPEGTIITSDNCSLENYSLDISTFDCDNLGENTVQVSVTDQSGNTTTKEVTVNVLGEQPTISIPDFTTVDGQKLNTFYLGYNKYIHLKTVVTGGKGFTYQWSDDTGNVFSTEASPKVSPRITTTYNVTVTNSNGCSDTASIEVCVIDARSKDKYGRYNGKVNICHHHYGHHHHGHHDDRNKGKGKGKGKDKKHYSCDGSKDKLISVSAKSVKGHLKHGDVLGGCEATCITEIEEEVENLEIVSMYPNPSSSGKFYVTLENFTQEARIEIYNFYGRLVQYKKVKPNSKSKYNSVKVKMGDYKLRDGNYVVKVYSNNKVFTKVMIINRNSRD